MPTPPSDQKISGATDVAHVVAKYITVYVPSSFCLISPVPFSVARPRKNAFHNSYQITRRLDCADYNALFYLVKRQNYYCQLSRKTITEKFYKC